MTAKRFWDDPYQTHLQTVVATVQGTDVTLRETIFYAQSGGQESDAGTIGGQPVLSAHKQGLDIIYTLPDGHGVRAGDVVDVDIDWVRRYRLMRLHFAAEVILELMYRQHPSVEKVGAHIAQDKARIDFGWAGNISAVFPALTTAANELVAADLPIISAFSDVVNQRRYWEVADFAHVPCGGTHLKHTGEVGEISLKRRNIGKGKERIEVYVP